MEQKTETYVLHLTESQFRAVQEWSARASSGARLDPSADLDSVDVLENLSRELAHARPKSLEDLVSFEQDRLREDYFSDVSALAEELLEEALEGIDADADADTLREDLSERLWEAVDGSAWVIYTERAIDVLRVSENDSYSVDEWGTEGIVSDSGIDWSRLAFGAMFADVSDHLWTDLDAWVETRDDFLEELGNVPLELLELRDLGDSAEVADRYTFSLELADGESVDWTMSGDADSPSGVCQSTESVGDGTLVSILSTDVPDGVRTQALRLVAWTVQETESALEEARTALADARTTDPTEQERVDALEETARMLGMGEI